MDDDIYLLSELLIGDKGILVPLRLGDGLSPIKVDMAIKEIERLAIKWSQQDAIPKKAVDLFIDIFPAMESTLGLYEESEQIIIMDAADKLISAVRKCINT